MASSGLTYPSKPRWGPGSFLPLPREKEGSCLAPLIEAQGAFYHGSLYSVTVPTRKGPGTVCGSSWGSGEVLDRVADLHTGPIESPAQTQHCQQDDKCPGCIDASISQSPKCSICLSGFALFLIIRNHYLRQTCFVHHYFSPPAKWYIYLFAHCYLLLIRIQISWNRGLWICSVLNVLPRIVPDPKKEFRINLLNKEFS